MLIILIAFLPTSWAASVSVAWDPNSEPDLSGYTVYYGTSSRSYTNTIDVGDVTEVDIHNLVEGETYYIAATAYDTNGNESEFSEELIFFIPYNDTDGDGLSDSEETNIYGTDPALADTDADGLDDGEEVNLYATDPLLADSDWDGVNDGSEISNGSDPLISDNDNGGSGDESKLEILDVVTESGVSYEVVASGAQIGDAAYIDRNYTIENLPADLEQMIYIRTANDDKYFEGTNFLSFFATQDVTVYVAHDHRIDPKPDWMVDFVSTGHQVITSDTILDVFYKYFPAGDIYLGGNYGSSSSMYVIFIGAVISNK